MSSTASPALEKHTLHRYSHEAPFPTCLATQLSPYAAHWPASSYKQGDNQIGSKAHQVFLRNTSLYVSHEHSQVLTKKLMDQDAVVLQCASTGAAAMRLSKHARTAHSLLRIPVSGSQRYYSVRNMEYHLLRRADVLIIDEYTMLQAQDLEFILNTIRLCKGAQTTREALLHIAIVFVGDPKQLRAICRHMQQV